MRERPAQAISLAIECAKSIHDVIPTDDPACSGHAQIGGGLQRTGVGRPRRQNGALFAEGEIGIAHDIHRVRKRSRRVQECIEIEFIVGRSLE